MTSENTHKHLNHIELNSPTTAPAQTVRINYTMKGDILNTGFVIQMSQMTLF